MKNKIFKFICGLFVLNSFAILAQDNSSWKYYPYQAPGSEIIFPKDEGKHHGLPNMEWWYAVMHLTGQTSGDRYAVLVTHFNNQIRFFTVTNLDKKIHTSGTELGPLHSASGKLDLLHKTKFGNDIFRSKKDASGKLIPFEYELKTHHKQMNLAVELKSTKRPLMVAGDGYIAVGSSGYTYYYSLTNLNVTGTLEHLGKKEKVTGIGWMDHQWGPFLISPFEIGNAFETYEWFCLQLDNGMEIMISNIYDRDRRLPTTEEYGGVELVYPNGKAIHTEDRHFKRTAYWQDPVSGHTMSMGWELHVPSWDLKITMIPDLLEQMVQLPLKGAFWEGSIKVDGRIKGQVVKGKAFGELIHRFERPELEILHLKKEWRKDETLMLEWKVKNPDEGNPLHFNVYKIQNGREIMLKENLVSPQYRSKINVLLSDQKISPFAIKIKAFSIDHTISSEVQTAPLKIIP